MKAGFKIRFAYVLAGALLLLALFLVGVVLWPQPQGPGLAITLVGFTNVPGRPQTAVFGVTNHNHHRSISFLIAAPQVRTGGIWAGVTAVHPAIGNRLGAGQGTNVSADTPAGGAAWRMPILWSFELNEWEFDVHRVKNLLRTIQQGSLPGWQGGFSLETHTNFSAEMELSRAEPDEATSRSRLDRSETNRTSSPAGSGR